MPDNQQDERVFSSTLRKYSLRVLRHENAILVIVLIALMGALSAITGGVFFSAINMRNILLQSSILGVAAVGQTFVILSAGIDLSVGGVGQMMAILGAVLLTGEPGYLGNGGIPLAAGIIIVLLAGAGMGASNGALVSRLNLSPLIVTLGIWQFAKGAAFQFSKEGETIHDLPRSLSFLGQGNIAGVPVPSIIFIVAIVIGFIVLNYTRFGRSVYTVGGNEVSAWLSGIKTRNIRFWVYVISGFCAAIGGLIQISRIMGANVAVLYGLELDSIAAVVIGGVSIFGGKGSMIGVLIGVLILGVINNGMNLMGLNPQMKLLVRGGLILAAVAIDALRRRR